MDHTNTQAAESDVRAKQAVGVWGLFLIFMIIVNGTIPFILGRDLRTWTASPLKDMAIGLVSYSLLYLMVPLILTKGWATVRQPAFLLPLLIAIGAMTARTYYRPVAALAVLVLAYLHWRFDLSELGFRSNGWRGDLLGILLIGLIYLAPALMQPGPFSFTPAPALLASLDRLFANPASTTEWIFYLGFLTERLSHKLGRLWTPLLVGLLYMIHEMSNPEYWYEGSSFGLIWIGVALVAWIYLWRRSVIVVWLGDGLGRFISNLF